LPLLGTGWVSFETRPEAIIEGPQLITSTRSRKELPVNDEVPITSRRAAESPVHLADAFESPPLPVIKAFKVAELPLLPINALLEEDATPARYAEWYEGTPIEPLYQSLVRMNALRVWDPSTCACADPELLFQHSKTHDRVHALNEQGELLLHEVNWLRSEVRRQLSADLESGGSLQVFRLPRSEAQLRGALEESSLEELKVLDQLLRDARSAARSAAVEAEFAAGNFKVGAHGVWG